MAQLQFKGEYCRIGVDTGGTFTDLVLYRSDQPDRWWTYKLLSTPLDPAEAVLRGLKQICRLAGVDMQSDLQIIHGSTVATNALLEGKCPTPALITTEGFEDIPFLARQNRTQLYSLHPHGAAAPIDRAHCLPVRERLEPDGSVAVALTDSAIDSVLNRLLKLDVDAVAISLLHSYANPEHERRLADAIGRRLPELHVTVSSGLSPEFREYERTSSCLVNAAVAPVMLRYLNRLGRELGEDRLRIMGSAGGSLPVSVVRREPVQTIVSGPAGGVIGAVRAVQGTVDSHIVSFDMGGTSTDVAICPGQLQRTVDGGIADLPVRLPVIDIHTVGAGGGSMAYLDAGGAMRVGPESVGADPGPACYGRQVNADQPAVTDAHVVLGHLPADHKLGGDLVLDVDAAACAIDRLAAQAGLDRWQTAHGILRIAETTMARAIRKMTVEKGYDPRDFSLVCFGGAGGLHACRLAGMLGMERVVLPNHAGLLSAVGMLASAPLYSFNQAMPMALPIDDHAQPIPPQHLPEVIAGFDRLIRKAEQALANDGIDQAYRRYTRSVDLRFAGQSYELNVTVNGCDVIEQFCQQHKKLYGYVPTDRPVELIALRLLATADLQMPTIPPLPARTESDGALVPDATEVRDAEGLAIAWQRVARLALRSGDELAGPLVITDYASTCLVPADWTMSVDGHGRIILSRTGAAS